MVRKSMGAPPAAHGTLPAEPSTAADALQRPLRSRFQARLSASDKPALRADLSGRMSGD
jgi:hypothetical protein